MSDDTLHAVNAGYWRTYIEAWMAPHLPPTPWACPSCPHLIHFPTPGIGCTTRGCLCLNPGPERTPHP